MASQVLSKEKPRLERRLKTLLAIAVLLLVWTALLLSFVVPMLTVPCSVTNSNPTTATDQSQARTVLAQQATDKSEDSTANPEHLSSTELVHNSVTNTSQLKDSTLEALSATNESSTADVESAVEKEPLAIASNETESSDVSRVGQTNGTILEEEDMYFLAQQKEKNDEIRSRFMTDMPKCANKGRAKAFLLAFMGHSGSTAIMLHLERSHTRIISSAMEAG